MVLKHHLSPCVTCDVMLDLSHHLSNPTTMSCQGLFHLSSDPKHYQLSSAYIIQLIPTSNPHPHYIRLLWGCSSEQLYSSSDAVGAPQLDL